MIGTDIRLARESRELSQRQLCNKLWWNDIHHIEQDYRAPVRREVQQLNKELFLELPLPPAVKLPPGVPDMRLVPKTGF